jgi:uroporphyrinogen decarboxylase
MKMGMDHWKRSIIASAEVKVLPIMTYPGLQLTNLSVLDVVTSAEHQAACVEALAKRYPSSAAVMMMDLSLEAEAFGAKVVFSESEVPTVGGALVTDRESLQALAVPSLGEKRIGAYLKATELVTQRVFDRPVFGAQIGPFSLAGRLVDMNRTMLAVRRDPAMLHAVLEKSIEFLVHYARAIKASGANGLIIAEPAAGLISPAQCDQFSSPYVSQIVQAVQDENFMVILHNCGNTAKLVPSMISTDAAAMHFGNAVRMADIAPQIPSDRLFLGNIEPAGLFRMGNPEQMQRAVASLLNEMAGFPNFVLSSGCDIPPRCPLENVDAFFKALDDHNHLHPVRDRQC